MTMTVWLVEAPGPHYLGVRNLVNGSDFFWTRDRDKAIPFITQKQADSVMMGVRTLNKDIFNFAKVLSDPKPTSHSCEFTNGELIFT